ncbi:hypothetical protein GRAQ_01753 [Rahnella aquatilis CIP 78.65 = ATCC 33071]|nr:hypothetical protein GRAQ_01753 [Rahnella aquatilis CIP 78.65 = ATCC 33071]
MDILCVKIVITIDILTVNIFLLIFNDIEIMYFTYDFNLKKQ